MARDIADFEGSVEESQDNFHVAVDGSVRLINFDVNKTALKPGHLNAIDRSVVPFLVSAVKFFGAGDYDLHVVGLASATGSFTGNAALSDQRAENAGKYAVAQWKKQARDNPEISASTMRVVPRPNADTAAKEDVVARKIPPSDIEKKQAHFRAAQFMLNARKKRRKGDTIYQIREIFLFKFTSKQESLPDALAKLKFINDHADFLKPVAKRLPLLRHLMGIMDKFSKGIEALGAIGIIATTMIKFMIPEEMDSCYEIKDSDNIHALYRLNGSGNKMSVGVLDVLSWIAESVAAMKAVVSALKTASKLPKQADLIIKDIEALEADFHKGAVAWASSFGPQFGFLVDTMLTMSEGGVTTKAMFAPASEFTPFRFHDQLPGHKVDQQAGPARRTSVGTAFFEAIDIEFGGFVKNNFRDFQAEARYTRNVVDLLSVQTLPRGQFFLLKSNYRTPVIVGPTDIITD